MASHALPPLWGRDSLRDLPVSVNGRRGPFGQRYQSGAQRVHRFLLRVIERPAGQIWKTYYFAGSQVVALRVQGDPVAANNGVFFFVADHLGSTSLTLDASGTKIGEMKYTPFGETRYTWGGTPTDRRFTGQKEENGLGSLYDFNARAYSPLLGRFISADSIIPGAASGSGGGAATLGVDSSSRLTTLTTDFHEFIGQVTKENQAVLQYGPFFQWSEKVRQDNPVPSGPLNPQALNRYAYCLNNPLRYVDPTGHTRYTLAFELKVSVFAWGKFYARVDGYATQLAAEGAVASAAFAIFDAIGIAVVAFSSGGVAAIPATAFGGAAELEIIRTSGLVDSLTLKQAITSINQQVPKAGSFTLSMSMIYDDVTGKLTFSIVNPADPYGTPITIGCDTARCAARYFGAALDELLANQVKWGVTPKPLWSMQEQTIQTGTTFGRNF